MGMHHSILVADMPWQDLHATLSALTGRFASKGPMNDLNAIDFDAIERSS
jgi:hypothetical protein